MRSGISIRSLMFPCAIAVMFLSFIITLKADDEFIIGATVHFGHNKGLSVEENLKVFIESGMFSPRDDSTWKAWEKEKGIYRLSLPRYRMTEKFLEKAPQMGLKPLQILGYGNPVYDKGNYPKSPEAIEAFVKYCEAVVKQYKGKLYLYQLWNEWDGFCGMPKEFKGQGDVASYVKLQAMTYPKIKAIDPSVTVITNSICTTEKFLEDALKLRLLKSCDGVSFHSYHYHGCPKWTDTATIDKRKPEAYVERIAGIDKLIKRYNDGKEFPIYLTEAGWPNHITNNGSTDAETGDYLARTYLLIKTISAVKGLWWYEFQCSGIDPKDNESNFGMVRPDLTPKEPYYVMRSISEIVRRGKFIERIQSQEKGLIALKFKMPDGQDVIAAWTTLDGFHLQVTLKNSKSAKGKLKTFLAGFAQIERDWGSREWVGLKSQMAKTTAPFTPDSFQFSVKGRPFIIMGDLDGVEIEKVQRIEFPDTSRSTTFHKVPDCAIGFAFPESRGKLPIKFGHAKNYRSLEAGVSYSSKDLDAAFSISWEQNAINLTVEVSDDKFAPEESGNEIWNGDSVQVAFQNLSKNSDNSAYTEFTFSLRENVPSVVQSGNTVNHVVLAVKREESKIIYSAKIPAKDLGIEMIAPESVFGFSILVNDNDGTGRKGYLHWGDGIGNSKDPAEYNWIVVKEW